MANGAFENVRVWHAPAQRDRCTRKEGAAGVDGMTADEYEQDLEGNLHSLLDRAKPGSYQEDKCPFSKKIKLPTS